MIKSASKRSLGVNVLVKHVNLWRKKIDDKRQH